MFRFHKKHLQISIVLIILATAIATSGGGAAALPEAVGGLSALAFTDSGQALGDDRGRDVALGDLDGDGDLDAFVANQDAPSVAWFNQGGQQGGTPGTFAQEDQTLGSSGAVAVDLGDLDGDGDLDAFVVRDGVAGTNEIWINRGGAQGGPPGFFQANGQTIGDDNHQSVALGDLDDDGDLDAFVARSLRPDRVWLNEGAGQFTAGALLGGNELGQDVALADVDGDGDLDAFVANGGATGDRVWLNDGDAAFADSGQALGATASSAVALADLAGDGLPEAYVAATGYDTLWLNQGGVYTTSGQLLGAQISSAVALGDVDGDGDRDAFVANWGGNTVWMNEAGVFADAGLSLGAAQSDGVALGDLDGDGDVDAFVTNLDGPDRVWLNEGGGATGYFSVDSQALQPAYEPWDVALGDLDGDGDLDLYVSILEEEADEVWFNDGAGGFVGYQIPSVQSASVSLGDVDGDGDLDAVVDHRRQAGGHILLNDGHGVFSDSGRRFGDASFNTAALGDLDGDGDLDVLLARRRGTQPDRVLEALLNDGLGNFSQHWEYSERSTTMGVALGDLDGDGDLDAFEVRGDYYGGAPGVGNRVWLNNGAGTFTNSAQELGWGHSTDAALGDMDGDGDLDALVTNWGEAGNRIWVNDGAAGFSDSGQPIGGSGFLAFGGDVSLADLDENGTLDAVLINRRGWSPNEYSLQVWRNAGNLMFHLPQCLFTKKTSAVALGDVDGDGDTDVVAATFNEQIDLWRNGRSPFTYNTCACSVDWLEEQGGAVSPRSPAGQRPPGILAIDLALYYRVRDELLARSATGRHYTARYYEHNLEILGHLVADDTLRDDAIAALELWQGHLAALLDGQGEAATIDAAQVAALDDMLTRLSAVASPELAAAIAEERSRLPALSSLAGLTMAEAYGVVVGYDIYLPGLVRP